MDGRQRDPEMLERCRAEIRKACEKSIADSNAFPYRLSMPEESIRFQTYGWVVPGDMFGYHLLMGYAIDQKQEYLDCALHNLNYTHGANAFGYFLFTGLGAKRNIEMVSDVANNDDIIEPIPGIPLGIGSPGFYWLAKYEKRTAEGTHPAEGTWPLLNRWYDGFNVQSEFTMGPMMRETIVAGYFASMSDAKPAKPVVKIKTDRHTGPAPLTVKFQADTQGGASGGVRQIFWDFDDETFSVQAAPSHVFADEGREYRVAVTVVDDRGRLAYDTLRVIVRPSSGQDGASGGEPFKADEQTLLLLHFDGDLKDASRHKLELKQTSPATDASPLRFASDAVGWMEKPAGSSLVLTGKEQFSVTIPYELMKDHGKTPSGGLTVEMMVYVKAFAGYAFEGNPTLLGLGQDYDSMLAWSQDKWDQTNAPRFLGGNGAVYIPSTTFKEKFPLNRWCHVRFDFDGAGKVRFFLNGKPLAEAQGTPFNPSRTSPFTFWVGPFSGMIDEVRMRRGITE
jgi:PKD repeat protein